jgi:di- and tripeptidase
MNAISNSLKTFTTDTFNSLASPNTFGITITHQASWWLTSLDSPYFKALEESVQDVWGKEPLKIREGGTVPTIFWLEREFGAPCVHLPLGQVSYRLNVKQGEQGADGVGVRCRAFTK